MEVLYVSFGALTLLVGNQEVHPIYKTLCY